MGGEWIGRWMIWEKNNEMAFQYAKPRLSEDTQSCPQAADRPTKSRKGLNWIKMWVLSP